MIHKQGFAILLAACLLAAHIQLAGQDKQGGKDESKSLIERGDYLVNQVARCGDCHTPRNARGKLDAGRHLQGAPMWFTPRLRLEEFENHAPDITRSGRAGRWTETRMIKFLSTGQKSDPPMPAYRLTVNDARAVTAYLRSLSGKKRKGRARDDD
jgi:mono/diheme cytochrome c family protein